MTATTGRHRAGTRSTPPGDRAPTPLGSVTIQLLETARTASGDAIVETVHSHGCRLRNTVGVCHHERVKASRILRPLGVALALTWLLQSTAITPPSASAEPCPDVQVLFARGTDEAPGLGETGQSFVDALRSRLPERSLNVYPVNYPATNDWPTGVQGIRDAASHIEATAATCPKTKMVLSGFSQGAAVMAFTTADTIPDGVDGTDVPRPMPPEMADHVAAVVLFGTPNERAMNFLGQPAVVIGPAYTAKTIQLCTPEDPVCSEGLNFSAHAPDAYGGIVDEGAAYAANRL